MSVFTPIDRPLLVTFLRQYELGELLSYQGIAEGITNTNYYVETESGQHVLTLYEALAPEQPPYLLALIAHLRHGGVACARPIAGRDGLTLRQLAGKPVALLERLPGAALSGVPTLTQCRAVAGALANLHLAGADFGPKRDNDFGPDWWRATARWLNARLSPEQRTLLESELRFQALYRLQDAPRGAIHGDLFRDNSLFEGDTLRGIIDFDFACTEVLLFDVAVAVNDWCNDADQALDQERTGVFLDAYHANRPFNPIERGLWPVMLRAAALRWWLSRLRDYHAPRAGESTYCKDPEVFETMLRRRIGEAGAIQRLWPRQPAGTA